MELELELELKIMELELELNWKNGIDPNPAWNIIFHQRQIIPADTRRNNNGIMTQNDIKMTLQCRFDVIMTVIIASYPLGYNVIRLLMILQTLSWHD